MSNWIHFSLHIKLAAGPRMLWQSSSIKSPNKPNNYARALFLYYSSAFNTIQPDILISKLSDLGVHPYLIHWYTSFLINRVQLIKVNDKLSSAITASVGAPQGCVSSALLFTLYIDDCRTHSNNQYKIKYSGDTVLLTLLSNTDSPGLHQQGVDQVVMWSKKNALEINTKKRGSGFQFKTIKCN